MTERRERGIDL